MGVVSKGVQVALRIFQLICSVIVLGILARFVHRVSAAGGSHDGRVIYGLVVASISTLFALVFIVPLLYSFLVFPFDFALFVMWLVLFCLLITRSGTSVCSSSWFCNYWGYYWGGFWRNPFFNGNTSAGCGHWRTSLAFSFMAMVAFLVTSILGAWVVSRHWTKRRRERRAGTSATTGTPTTSQIGGHAPAHGTGAGAAPGTAHATQGTTHTGTYV
ncbi:uncharacterized protein B0T15DRAFT_221934 [Chaetomium strumarium]|uniref:MARVEL domain-containing protein n=1 Tax=Chaetomium strumarium TaxID=1170767 RepID=A0AAJ0GUB5_9PEZI|nr:hypothetical protein B0T15DRAFT_221934 [Chaetomium strumarium]